MLPGPFWSWNDKLDEAELRRQIREMAEKGWGSYFMHSRVGLVTGYLSDEWMALINACADEAAKTGTYAWLYDEDKWPSGFAGGEVPEMDESYRMRGLVLVKQRRGRTAGHCIKLCSTWRRKLWHLQAREAPGREAVQRRVLCGPDEPRGSEGVHRMHPRAL